MSSSQVFRVTLLGVLLYLLLELLLGLLHIETPKFLVPAGMIMAVASVPWSLLALEFFRGTESFVGTVVRNFSYIMAMALGVALNAVLLSTLIDWFLRLFKRKLPN